jgi:hypothetical protein
VTVMLIEEPTRETEAAHGAVDGVTQIGIGLVGWTTNDRSDGLARPPVLVSQDGRPDLDRSSSRIDCRTRGTAAVGATWRTPRFERRIRRPAGLLH